MSKRKSKDIIATEHEDSKEFVIGPLAEMVIDPHSKSRYINLPFTLKDKSQCVLIVLRAKDEPWVMSKDIKSIIINYVETKN